MKKNYKYEGEELHLFANATNWKKYVAKIVSKYIKGHVLEVGAGIGSNTKLFMEKFDVEWTCLEPDKILAQQISPNFQQKFLTKKPTIIVGSLRDIDPKTTFDTILYIDVLEHLKDDRAELIAAANHLTLNGHLIAISPAFQFLYSPFDKKIGHFRRYNSKMLRSLSPETCVLENIRYLDSAGSLLSATNCFFLKRSIPSINQIKIWDKIIVPISIVIDPLIFFRFGKSISAVWRRKK